MKGPELPSNPDTPISTHTYTIGGIAVHIHGLDQLRPYLTPSSPLTSLICLHALHPRGQEQGYMVPTIHQCLVEHYYPNSTTSTNSAPKVGLIGISFDQRNHGTRLVSATANNAFRERHTQQDPDPSNPHHALDMFSIYHGTTVDLELIMDYLPAYFEMHYNPPPPIPPQSSSTSSTTTQSPTLEHIPVPEITGNIAFGVSLGGHAAYLTLLHNPRITAVASVIGCADYEALMRGRLKRQKILPNSDEETRYLPSSFLQGMLSRIDPAAILFSSTSPKPNLRGKHLLVLTGLADTLVPPHLSQKVLDTLKGEYGVSIRNIAYEGVGHQYTDEMGKEVTVFVKEFVSGLAGK